MRHRLARRSWNTPMMRNKVTTETTKRCLGNLEHHGEFSPEEEHTSIDLYKGFNVYIEQLNPKKPVEKEILDEFWTHWIKEFLKGICKRVRTLGELGEVHKTCLRFVRYVDVYVRLFLLLGLSEGWGILGPYQLVHVKFGISSWRGSRVDGRSYLQSGAIDGSEANGIIRDPKSCKVRVGSNGNLLWEASVLYDEKKGGVRVAREDDRGVTEGREDVREVFQQRGSGAKRKLSKCGRTQMGNEPILALLDGADDFVVYYDARSKDLEACLEKGRR
ncbi:hypothetical protein Tco_0779239 [Tanacetum coccineum]